MTTFAERKKRIVTSYEKQNIDWESIFSNYESKKEDGLISWNIVSKQTNIPASTLKTKYKKWKSGITKDRRFKGLHAKRGYLDANEEKTLDSSLTNLRKEGYAVSKYVIYDEACNLFPQKKNLFTLRWASRFGSRYSYTKRKANASQKGWKISEWSQKAKEFQEECSSIQHSLKLEPKDVSNSDETMLVFGDQGHFTLEKSGVKAVGMNIYESLTNFIALNSHGNTKMSITVVWTIRGDGFKYPLAFIFRGKKGPKNVVVPQPHKKFVTKKGWVNSEIWGKIQEQVIFPNIPKNTPHLLVCDSYSAHLQDLSLLKSKNRGIRTIVIPGGMTSALQPLDRSIFGPFKTYVREKWKKHFLKMRNMSEENKSSENDYQTLVNIAISAYEEINSEMIQKAFRLTGVINDDKYPIELLPPPIIIPEESEVDSNKRSKNKGGIIEPKRTFSNVFEIMMDAAAKKRNQK